MCSYYFQLIKTSHAIQTVPAKRDHANSPLSTLCMQPYWALCFCRYIVFLCLVILINGLGIDLPKRRCTLSDDTNIQDLTPRKEHSDHHSLYDRDLVSQDASNTCKQKYIVPLVWHVIIDSNKNGDVSDAVLQKQVDILNGNLTHANSYKYN